MANQVGKRYQCAKCGTEMIVTKGGEGISPAAASRWSKSSSAGGGSMSNQLGKRFQCEKCGSEVLCIKPGDGEIECCGAPMQLMQPKVLPSAD